MARSLEGLKVKDVMTRPVRSLNGDTTLKDASRFFLAFGFTGAPVVDEAGKPVGVITLKDLVRFIEHHLELEENEDAFSPEIARAKKELGVSNVYLEKLHGLRVEQIMTPRVVWVRQDADLLGSIRYMLREKVHRLFVADAQGTLVGVFSTSDVVRVLIQRADEQKPT
jgi:predicted transcriptional regulator